MRGAASAGTCSRGASPAHAAPHRTVSPSGGGARVALAGSGRRRPCCPSAALATLQTLEATVDATCRAAEAAGGFFLPPSAHAPARWLRRGVPFLTRQAGQLPTQPEDLEHALALYGGYTSKYCSVRVENVHIRLTSWDEAASTLRAAEAGRRPYWCSLIEGVRHPGWWPQGGHVPTYDQVIFGRGNASIGLHFDKDNGCANGTRRPVATYLAISAGAKLCLLLPPGQTLIAAPGGDAADLLRPTAALLRDVRAAGGHFFLLRPDDDGAPVALYMPAGWFHWVVGLTDWHVVYGGSFYPEEQPHR